MKTHANTHKVIIRRDAVKKDGTAALALRVRIGGQAKFLPLGVSVPVKCFNEGKQEVAVPRDRDLTEKVNLLIKQARAKAQRIFLDALIVERTLTMLDFLERFTGSRNQSSFTDYFEKWIASFEGVKAPNTLDAYGVTLRNLKKFQKDVRFSELTPEFAERLDKFFHRKGFDVNYITKQHKLIQAGINAAIKAKIIAENPYEGFKFRYAKTERDFLNLKELQSLIDLYNRDVLPTAAQEVLRYFLFCCVAGGIRLCDVQELLWEEVVGDWLVFRPNKTAKSRTVLKVPLSDLAKSIIHDLPRSRDKIFQCKADAVTNRLLKVVQREAGISQLLTFHVSRHTFATVYLALGGKVHVLQKIMGHSKIETTMIYVHVAHEQKVEDMKRFDFNFGRIGDIEVRKT
ncbi:MAG: tyrosine-type recombinase/integrase [Saprospiraceae bacterium]